MSRRGRVDAAIATGLAALARLAFGASARWVDGAPAPGQRIYFANHTSHLDFVILWSALPPALRARTRPVAAGDYWRRGKLRPYLAARVFDAALVERGAGTVEGARAQIERLVGALADGSSLIVFPEGTRGTGEAIAPFKSGLYHLARACPEVELVPVYLENLNRILPKGEILPIPMLSHASFGAPLRLGDGEEKAAFLARARATIEGLRG